MLGFHGLSVQPISALEVAAGGPVTATLSQTIANFSLASDSDLLLQATLSQSIGNFLLSADADVLIQAVVNQATGNFSLSSDSDLLLQASLTQSIGAFGLSSAAGVLIEADAGVGSIGNFALSATGALLIQASVTQAIGNFGLSSDADLHIQATLQQSIGVFSLAADADVIIEGDAGVGSIGDFTLDFSMSHLADRPPGPGGWLPVKMVGGRKLKTETEPEPEPLEISDEELAAFLAQLQIPVLREAQIAAAIEDLKARVLGEVRDAELQLLAQAALQAMAADEEETDLLLLSS